MNAKHLALLFCCLVTFAMCGCSTVQSRLHERRAAFQKMSPREQELVLHKEVREGMTPDAVYIAWGKPDEITRGTRGGHPLETWTYYIATQQVVPHYLLAPRVVGRRYFSDTIYDPYYVTQWYPYRAAIFENGRVVSWQANAKF